MNREIVFIADFFVEHILGGGELNNEELILILKERGYPLSKKQSHTITLEFLREKQKAFFIISNFLNLTPECKELLKNLDYAIYEHDHKYLRSRNPATYSDFKAPQKDLLNYYFYKNAIAVLGQSAFHKQIIEKNLQLPNVVNLGGNLWSLESLKKIREISKRGKKEQCSILNSAIDHKNTGGAIKYCSVKGLPYQLISNPDYFEFLEEMGTNSKFVFFPQTPETLSRVIVEARMMGLAITTNNLVGATSEEWFKLKGEELIDLMIEKREEIANKIETLLNKETSSKDKPLISIISTFYEGEKYLNNFLENITSQTVFDKCELILIDANSPGTEQQIVAEYADKHKNIVYHRLDERENITNSLNIAAKLAKGKFLTFAFIDDIKRKDCIEILLNNILNDKNLDLIYGDVLQTTNANETFESNSANGILFEHSTLPFSKENMIKCLPGPMPLWKKSIHDNCGFLDAENCDFADDWEMWLRAVQHGCVFKKIDQTVGLYYAGGRSNQEENLKQKQEEAKIFYQYAPLFGANFHKYKPYFDQFLRS
jgi:GT2 family glycosyltransferase